MKKLITIVLIVVAGVILYQSFFAKGGTRLLSVSGDRLKIERGKNSFTGETRGEYQEDLRVYGVADNKGDGDWSPLGYADYLLTASVWTGNTTDCERNDAANAAVLNIIVEDEDVRNKLEKLKDLEGRRRIKATGREVRIKKFLFEGEDHSDSLKKQGKLNPGKAIIIDEIRIVE